MDGIESFSEKKNLARVAAGFKGVKFFQNLNTLKPSTFVEGDPPEVIAKLNGGPIPMEKPIDPWVFRYPGSKLK